MEVEVVYIYMEMEAQGELQWMTLMSYHDSSVSVES